MENKWFEKFSLLDRNCFVCVQAKFGRKIFKKKYVDVISLKKFPNYLKY